MLIYWALFAFFALGALITSGAAARRSRVPLALGATVIAILVGLRYEVGADWPQYEFIFSYAGRVDLWRVLELGDVGYQIVNWTVQRLDWQIWVVNMVCGAIFAWGLYRFCVAQADPWLALKAAIDAVLDRARTVDVRIAFVEAPTVLGLEAWREIEKSYSTSMLQDVLRELMVRGAIQPRSVDVLAAVLRGAINEAAMVVAESPRSDQVRREAGELLDALLEGLRPRGRAS